MAANIEMLPQLALLSQNLYQMIIDGKQVDADVTDSRSQVLRWIDTVEKKNTRRLHRLIVVVDVLLNPSTTGFGVLLLLVNTDCLMYKIRLEDGIPIKLKGFLNKNYTYVGADIAKYNKRKLYEEYTQTLAEVTKLIDLSEMAAMELGEPDLKNATLEELSLRFIGKNFDPKKHMKVRSIDWGRKEKVDIGWHLKENVCPEQVLCANWDLGNL